VGWEKRHRYYTRSKKRNGRVVREYVGTGELAEISAEIDAMRQGERWLEAQNQRQEIEGLTALNCEIIDLVERTDLVARAALLAAGYHQHKRGEWRKRRGDSNRTGER
jgi:hypothetical protein